MKTRQCSKCSMELPATLKHFHKQTNGLYGLKSYCKICTKAYSDSRYKPIPKKTEKQCGRCKETFPITDKYFYTKTTKKGTITTPNGKPLTRDSTSFRSICKSCNTAKTTELKRKKLMIKYNASSEEELNTIIKIMRTRAGMKGAYANLNVPSKRRKYDYPINATPYEMSEIRRKKDMGYNPETYNEEWKVQWLHRCKERRTNHYPNEIAKLDKIPQNIQNKIQSDKLNDGFLANRLGFKLSEIPQDILELKRKQLKFYRLCQKQIQK